MRKRVGGNGNIILCVRRVGRPREPLRRNGMILLFMISLRRSTLDVVVYCWSRSRTGGIVITTSSYRLRLNEHVIKCMTRTFDGRGLNSPKAVSVSTWYTFAETRPVCTDARDGLKTCSAFPARRRVLSTARESRNRRSHATAPSSYTSAVTVS